MAMHQAYVIPMVDQTIIANSELITIRAATAYTSRASLLELLRIEVSQAGTATSQQLGIQCGLKASAFGTFTATTPVPAAVNTVASAIAGSTSNAASSAGTDASALGAGALTVMWGAGFNNLSGYLWVPTEAEQVVVGPDLSFIVKLIGTPTSLTNWYASLWYRELT